MRATSDARQLVLLCVTGGTAALVQAVVVPLVALYARHLGASASAIGGIVALGFLVPLLGAVHIGRVVDRFGARVVLLVGVALLGVGPTVAIAWPRTETLIALTILANLGYMTCIVAIQRAITSVSPSRERGFGWFTTCVSVGQLVGPLVMGRALEQIGFNGALASTVVVAFAGLLVGATTRAPDLHTLRMRTQPAVSLLAELRSLPAVWLSVGGSGGVMFAVGVHQAFYPIFLDALSASPTIIGVVLGARALASIMVRPFLATVSRRVGSRAWLLGTSLGLCAFGVIAPALGGSVAPMMVGSILLGIGSGFAQPMTMVVVADHVRPERRGAFLGGRMAVNYGAMGLSSMLLGASISLVGFSWSFLASGIVPFSLALAILKNHAAVDASPSKKTG